MLNCVSILYLVERLECTSNFCPVHILCPSLGLQCPPFWLPKEACHHAIQFLMKFAIIGTKNKASTLYFLIVFCARSKLHAYCFPSPTSGTWGYPWLPLPVELPKRGFEENLVLYLSVESCTIPSICCCILHIICNWKKNLPSCRKARHWRTKTWDVYIDNPCLSWIDLAHCWSHSIVFPPNVSSTFSSVYNQETAEYFLLLYVKEL